MIVTSLVSTVLTTIWNVQCNHTHFCRWAKEFSTLELEALGCMCSSTELEIRPNASKVGNLIKYIMDLATLKWILTWFGLECK